MWKSEYGRQYSYCTYLSSRKNERFQRLKNRNQERTQWFSLKNICENENENENENKNKNENKNENENEKK